MVRALFLHVCPFDRGGFPQPLPEAQSAEAFDNQGTGTGTRTEGGGGSSCSCSRLCFSITASPVSAYQLLRNANNQQQIKTPEVVMWEKAAGE